MASQIVDTNLWLDGYDLTGDMNAISANVGVTLQEDPRMGDVWKTRKPGLKGSAFQYEGYWDETPDEQLFANIGVDNAPVTFSPNGGTDGDMAYFMKALHAEYSPGAQIEDMYAFSVSGESKGPLVRGTLMGVLTTSSSGTGTARQLGAVTASQNLFAALHVTSAAGTSLDVDIESDTVGFPSAATAGSFATKSAIGSEFLEIAGPITDDYFRINYTIVGGSFSFIVAIGVL